ncbi:MAG TPA: nucleoside-diphosphate kinase [Planctomycetota bacterium]|jgi:nucleoside-diphosphate kinase|nr:nucleoside-diphosphate kinase [Planctomycetota bacterium]
MVERTLIILKPDAIQRGLMGRILTRFEEKGLKVVGAKFTQLPWALVERHYEPHKGKPFYPGLVAYMTKGPVLVLCLEGPFCIEASRKLMGATFGYKAEPGTIRGDFTASKGMNLVHGSDSPESAAREVALFFKPEELMNYELQNSPWTCSEEDRRATS